MESELKAALDRVHTLEMLLAETRIILKEVFVQACVAEYDQTTGVPMVDHLRVPAFEYAQSHLLQLGLLTADQCAEEVRVKHVLKIEPPEFARLLDGSKTFLSQREKLGFQKVIPSNFVNTTTNPRIRPRPRRRASPMQTPSNS